MRIFEQDLTVLLKISSHIRQLGPYIVSLDETRTRRLATAPRIKHSGRFVGISVAES